MPIPSPPAPSDVSVVVQGPVGPYLPEVLASVRRTLPGAQLVLSTWRGTVPNDVDADVVVENPDPGSAFMRRVSDGSPTTIQLNTNRMLLSASAGIAAVDRELTLKLRTDTPIDSPRFLSWSADGAARRYAPEYPVFAQRLLTVSVAVRPSVTGYFFHPSDCVHFGRTEDVALLWGCPLIDEVDNATRWLATVRRGGRPPLEHTLLRHWNEQVLWLSALERAGFPINYPYVGYLNADVLRASERSLTDNFVVLEPWQFGVRMPKLQGMIINSALWTYVDHEQWRSLEQRRAAA